MTIYHQTKETVVTPPRKPNLTTTRLLGLKPEQLPAHYGASQHPIGTSQIFTAHNSYENRRKLKQ